LATLSRRIVGNLSETLILILIQYLVRHIKLPILFSPIFSTNFSQLEQLKKKTNCWSKTVFFFSFGPINFLFLFQPSNWEKIVEKIGDNKIGCLVLFDVTNKIQKKHSNYIHNKDSDLKSSWAKYWKLLHCTIYFQICCIKKKKKSWTFFEFVNS
jgi:hypothetical protein